MTKKVLSPLNDLFFKLLFQKVSTQSEGGFQKIVDKEKKGIIEVTLPYWTSKNAVILQTNHLSDFIYVLNVINF